MLNGYVVLRWTVGESYLFVYEHRLVMGLPQGKHVHHKNGNRADNRIENLEILDPVVHKKKHAPPKTGRTCGLISTYQAGCRCPDCTRAARDAKRRQRAQ